MPSTTHHPRAYVNSKLLRSQLCFTLVAAQVAEQTGGGDIGGGVAAAVLSCAEMFSCALKTKSLFDGDFLLDSEIGRV